MIKPHRLEKGMTIGIIAPASGVPEPEKIDLGIERLLKMGYRVKEGKSLRSRFGYLASPDAARLADIHGMFRDPKVDAIMCVRGGYGTGRLLDAVDYAVIKKNPKIFIGFSDITSIQLAIWKRCGLVTFSGPMLTFTFAPPKPRSFTMGGFMRTLTRKEAPGSIWQGHKDRKFRVVRHGSASGALTGGNLSLACATIGTPYEIETRGKIVFLEDLDEKPYRIDRMLTQMLSAGKLRDAAAVVFGRNVPDEETAKLEKKLAREGLPRVVSSAPRNPPRSYEQTTDDVIADRLRGLGIPVIIGLPFGHIEDYATLPIGVRASMVSRTGELSIVEPAVI